MPIDLARADAGRREHPNVRPAPTRLTKLVVGNPGASSLVSQLSGGRMPQARPKMPTVDLNVIKAWITAGAPNN